MKILLELEINNEKEAELKYKFVNLLVDDLKNTLYNHIGEVNTIKVEKAILSSKQILWTTKQKPKSVNVDKCIKYIILSLILFFFILKLIMLIDILISLIYTKFNSLYKWRNYK